MKKITFYIFLIFSTYSVFAQQDYKPVVDKKIFIENYQKSCKAITSQECKFTQVKKISLMKQTLESNGKMYFRNDSKLKIEYLKPNLFVFALNGDKISIKDGDKPVTTISTSSNKLFKQISQITFNSINGKIFDSKDFTFDILENKAYYQIKAVPSSKELKAYYKHLLLNVNKKTFLIESIVMNEVSGDISTMYFKDIVTNSTLKDEIFAIR